MQSLIRSHAVRTFRRGLSWDILAREAEMAIRWYQTRACSLGKVSPSSPLTYPAHLSDRHPLWYIKVQEINRLSSHATSLSMRLKTGKGRRRFNQCAKIESQEEHSDWLHSRLPTCMLEQRHHCSRKSLQRRLSWICLFSLLSMYTEIKYYIYCQW